MPEAKYNSEDMSIMQGWPLERKVRVTQLRIMEWVQHWKGNVYVSFSGGKDSTILLDLVRRVYPEIPAVYVDTGFEYPEIRQFVKGFENVTWLRPEMNYKEIVQSRGYPVISKQQAEHLGRIQHNEEAKRIYNLWTENGQSLDWLQRHFYEVPQMIFTSIFGVSIANAKRFAKTGDMPYSRFAPSKKWRHLINAPFSISSECCEILKKRPFDLYNKQTGRKGMKATMANESQQRYKAWLMGGCNTYASRQPHSQPMSFWTEQDVLQYLKITKTPYCSVYGDIAEDDNGSYMTTGCSRTGCMGCLFGCHLEKEPNRLQRLKITHPKVYDYLFRVLDYGMVCDYIGIPY